MGHNPSVCNNKRVYQAHVEAEKTPLPCEVLFQKVCRMKATEAKGVDSYLDRNYRDILVDIYCLESNQIYVGIKCHVPSPLNVAHLPINTLSLLRDITYCVLVPGSDH